MDNWQPIISNYRTAVVTKVSNDKIDLVLAKRDRVQKEKTYDENGQRIYGKFEMPEHDEEDNGFLSLSVAELVEPKLLQASEDTSSILKSDVTAGQTLNLSPNIVTIDQMNENSDDSQLIKDGL